MPHTNLISIVGAGHSGSTLLDIVMDSHSQIWSVGEIVHWDQYLVEDKVCACGEHPRQCQFWSTVIPEWESYVKKRNMHPVVTNTRGASVSGAMDQLRHRAGLLLAMVAPVQKIPGLMRGVSPDFDTRATNINALYELVRMTSGKPIICDSSKSAYRHRWLHLKNPGKAKALFLTRDGRAVVASHLKRTNAKLERASRGWRYANLYTEFMLRTLPKDTYLHVRYEELCRDPETTVSKICTFLDLPFEPSMLSFSGDTQHNIGGNRMRMSGLNEIREDVKWRSLLTREQLRIFERIAGNTNKRLLGEYYQP